jgi:hypothetical protein
LNEVIADPGHRRRDLGLRRFVGHELLRPLHLHGDIEPAQARRHLRLEPRRDLLSLDQERDLLGVFVLVLDRPVLDGGAIIRGDVAQDVHEPLRLGVGLLFLRVGPRRQEHQRQEAQQRHPPEDDIHIQQG